jgi:protein-tyrosine phosphatase
MIVKWNNHSSHMINSFYSISIILLQNSQARQPPRKNIMQITRVLFVCLGNICRSPTAEGVFRALVEKRGLQQSIQIDSAGTSNWHIGSPPDSRAVEAARTRGFDISDLRGRQATAQDFAEFDYVIAMDHENYANLAQLGTPNQQARLHLFLEFADKVSEVEVPDPYFGSAGGFPRVLDLIENASNGLLNQIIDSHNG